MRIFTLLFLLITSSSLYAQDVAHLTGAAGKVFLKRNGAQVLARPNTPLKQGDILYIVGKNSQASLNYKKSNCNITHRMCSIVRITHNGQCAPAKKACGFELETVKTRQKIITQPRRVVHPRPATVTRSSGFSPLGILGGIALVGIIASQLDDDDDDPISN